MATLVNRQQPPIAILGVPFDNVTTADAISSIERMITSRQPHYVVTANVDFLVQAREDVELRRILFDAHLVLCDGTPLIWASRFLGNPLPERVAGADLVPLLIGEAAKKGHKLFFLGATPESAARAVAVLKQKYPALALDHYSPPFKHLLEMDHDEITRRIAAAKPDALLVSFGCPKQEKWIAMHYRNLGVPVAIGVGATIDFLAGQVRRAPRWMQSAGLEWIFRLLQEPRRLFKRYVKDLGVFGMAILAQWAGLGRARRAHNSSSEQAENVSSIPCPFHDAQTARPVLTVQKAPERLDVESSARSAQWNDAATRHLVLDMSAVRFIDSTGVGMLIRLEKNLRRGSRRLFLLQPSDNAMRALRLMHLHDYFDRVATVQEAVEVINDDEREVRSVGGQTEASLVMEWKGEVTAATADSVWEETSNFLTNAESPAATIDMSRVRFIDSSGLGIMLRARKESRNLGIELQFTDLQPAVINVIRLSKLQHLFGVEHKTSSNLRAPATGSRQAENRTTATSAAA